MATKKSLNTPIEKHWEDAVDDIYQKFVLLPGYDRPMLINWVACALKDAFEQGQSGKEYTPPHLKVYTPAVSTPVRRTRTPVAVVEVNPAPRVIRRRTRG